MSRLKCTRGFYEAEAVALSLKFVDRAHVTKIVFGFSATPTTSENMTVTLDSAGGSDHDTVLHTKDMVAEGVESSYVMDFEAGEMQFIAEDGIDIAYANTDVADISVQVYYEVTP